MLFVILVLLIALLAASPYIAAAFGRARLIKRLKRVAQHRGYTVHRLHVLVCLPQNRAPRYDLLFTRGEQAYAVKLWSAIRKNGMLTVSENGRACECTRIPPELETAEGRERTVRTRARRVPPTKNNFKLRAGVSLTPVMLYYPSGNGIVLLQGGRWVKLTSGDKLFGKLLCSPPYFEKILGE